MQGLLSITSAKRPRRTVLLALLAVAALLLAPGLRSVNPTAEAASAIETTYRATGSWAVSTGTASAFGGTYKLYYPTNLGAGGFRHPILTWGNGTNATPSKYDGILTHLASWGFVVIASNSGQTGLGTQILDGALYLVNQDGTPSSIFYQKLDVANVGALGHSQGAGGALNATINSGGLITSTITVALPDPFWWTTPVPNMASFPSTGQIFFIRGTTDFLATESAALNWYNPVPGGAAKAAQKSAGHNEIQKATTRLKGYVTAWMLYTLRGDANARAAFVGSPPEINTNTAWQSAAQKNLP
jgi:hypothetical protein